MSSTTKTNDSILSSAIRAISMDAVEKAKSGHPGMPMGMAEIAVALWTRHYRHNPANPKWFNRDRFLLSNGHGSMLHYALLHFAGYDLSMEEIKNFRQLHAKTPGHPEVDITDGVETTTGPLGQGIANAVGMALAEWCLASEFNREGLAIVDHFTYAFLGDGCLMEGISHEVCSLAGTLALKKLIFLYDDNGISIDGEVKHWFADHTPQRFASYGWHVLSVDGHDVEAVAAAIASAKAQALTITGKPTLICCKTIIGKGSPNKQGTDGVHGAALGAAEVAATREAIAWPHAPFEIPQAVYDGFNARECGAKLEDTWNTLFNAYQKAYPALADEFTRRMQGNLPSNFADIAHQMIADAQANTTAMATRKASQSALNALASVLPELLGGSAD